MRALAFAAALLLVVAAAPGDAFAARSAQVDVDNAEMFEGPEKGAKLVEKLPKGQVITTSNETTEGFYKVRTQTGSVGWINADALQMIDAAGSEVTPSSAPSSGGTRTSMSAFRKKFPQSGIRLRLVGGLDMFNTSDVNENFGFDELKNGFSYGLEFNFVLTSDVAVILRAEKVQKSIVARDQASLKTFQLDMTSYPTMMGVEMGLSKDGNFSTQFVALAGVGLLTRLVSTGLSFDEPNETVFSDTPLTVLGKINVGWAVSKSLGFFFEGGYRVLKTAKLSTSEEGNGSDIFKPSGSAVPISLDMNGIVLGAGISLTM